MSQKQEAQSTSEQTIIELDFAGKTPVEKSSLLDLLIAQAPPAQIVLYVTPVVPFQIARERLERTALLDYTENELEMYFSEVEECEEMEMYPEVTATVTVTVTTSKKPL